MRTGILYPLLLLACAEAVVDEPHAKGVSLPLDDSFASLATTSARGDRFLPTAILAVRITANELHLVDVHPLLEDALGDRSDGAMQPSELHGVLSAASTLRMDVSPSGSQLMPYLILPDESTSIDLLSEVLSGNFIQVLTTPAVVAWQVDVPHSPRRVEVAPVWTSLKMHGVRTLPDMSVAEEFAAATGVPEERIHLVTPASHQVCSAGAASLTDCEVSSRATPAAARVAVCGFDTWSGALDAISAQVQRVDDIMVLKSCSFQVSP